MHNEIFEPFYLSSSFLWVTGVIIILVIAYAIPTVFRLLNSTFRDFISPYRSSIPGIPESALIIDTILILVMILVIAGIIYLLR